MSIPPRARSPTPPQLSSEGRPFVLPDWRAPLDVVAAVNVSKEAQLRGMFFLALYARAKELNVTLPVARERYLPFHFYPLAEFMSVFIEAARRFYPGQTLREGLRTIGRGVPKALIGSTVGKVVFGSAAGVHDVVAAMVQTYAINLRPGCGRVLESAPTWMVVQLQDVHYFLDSHHVGILEGTMIHAGMEGTVQVAVANSGDAEFLLTW